MGVVSSMSIYGGVSKLKSAVREYPRAILLLFALYLIPLFIRSPYILHLMVLGYIYAILTTSWDLVCGYTGIFSFAHAAFCGIGAYTSSLLSMRMGINPWLTILVGSLTSTGIGFLIALPCLRLRGPYIVIVTLAFSEIARITCSNLVDITRGELGLWGIPPLLQVSGRREYYYLIALSFFAATLLSLYALIRSKMGYALSAIGQDELKARSIGINVTEYKLLAFSISAFFAGLAGGLYAHYVLLLVPSAILSLGLMVEIMTMSLIGGLKSLVGPAIGSFLLVFISEYLRAIGPYRFLIYGLLIMVIVIWAPSGMVLAVRKVGDLIGLTKPIVWKGQK